MQEKKRKQAETERKRAEVRARLEEASKAKKAKKGFMTPDRKKKLRVSPLFVSFFWNLVARSSMFPKPRDILFKNSIAKKVAANLSSYFSFRQWKTVLSTLMPRQVYKSMFYIASVPLPHRMFIIDNRVELLVPRFTLLPHRTP